MPGSPPVYWPGWQPAELCSLASFQCVMISQMNKIFRVLFVLLNLIALLVLPTHPRAAARPTLTRSGDDVITKNVGYIVGQVGSSSAQTASPTRPSPSPTPTSTNRPGKGFVVMPVATVTPQIDGSIIHIVQPGEVLLNIALAYNLKLTDLYKLNNLNEKSVIYPGEKIKIRGPDPTPTPTETPTPTHMPTATRRPTRTPTPTVSPAPTFSATSTVLNAPAIAGSTSPDPLLIAIGVLFLVGISLVVAGSLIRKK